MRIIRLAYRHGPGIPTVEQWSERESGVLSAHKAGRLSSPNTALKAWGIPGSCCPSVFWNLKRNSSNISKGMQQRQDGRFAGKTEGKLMESQSPASERHRRCHHIENGSPCFR